LAELLSSSPLIEQGATQMQTSAQVHNRIWKPCFNCTGIKASQPTKHCGFCRGTGELPRHPEKRANVWAGYSSFYERQAGA